ncbi:MAG: CCA tRNA nucleotidyltransferase [Rhizobiaceae bacterium]|nr:CCA tRNA nucleotidyltransferase [Rhizobiaceae bacterium]
MSDITLKDKSWLESEQLQLVLRILGRDGEEARVNGGAVRNAILGEPISDVDLSSTLLPEAAQARLEAEGIKVVPTGIEHGTITAIVDGRHFEITTLREDIETTGRHAVVKFGRDWERDALRRDLTMNALYCDGEGIVFDPLGGHEDLIARRVVFIGEAEERIREDYLRILRFFRFFAWYGSMRPDAAGLKACARLKQEISQLSVERVWSELKKLLAAPDPARALLWMRTAGVLTVVLPESEKWGIDLVPGLLRMEKELKWENDPLLRLISILPKLVEKVADLTKRLRLSGKEGERLVAWVNCPLPNAETSKNEFDKLLYSGDAIAMQDTLKMELARIATYEDSGLAGPIKKLLVRAIDWQRPEFPIKGRDLIAAGAEAGPELGKELSRLEAIWVDSDFMLDKVALLKA